MSSSAKFGGDYYSCHGVLTAAVQMPAGTSLRLYDDGAKSDYEDGSQIWNGEMIFRHFAVFFLNGE